MLFISKILSRFIRNCYFLIQRINRNILFSNSTNSTNYETKFHFYIRFVRRNAEMHYVYKFISKNIKILIILSQLN